MSWLTPQRIQLLGIIEKEIFNVKQDSPEERERWSIGVMAGKKPGAFGPGFRR
jgi:hypothetical protein